MGKRKYSGASRKRYKRRKRFHFKKRYRRAVRLGFPRSKMVKLRYTTEINLNPGAAGAAASYVFGANAMYDPDITGGGHQPKGFDEWMTFYDHYTVVGSKITVQPAVFATVAAPSWWGILISDDGLYASGRAVDDIVESAGKPGMAGILSSQVGGVSNPNKTRKFSCKKFFRKKNIVGSADYRGTAAANPNEMGYYEVWACGLGATDGDTFKALVTIDFLAVMTEPKILAQS